MVLSAAQAGLTLSTETRFGKNVGNLMSDETPGIPRLWAPLTTIWLKFTFI